jgi:hypothetical protein
MSMHRKFDNLFRSRKAGRHASLRLDRSIQLRFEPLEARRLLATLALNDFSVSNGTGEKPQSKVWEYADQWWTVMPSSGGTSVWRLDGTSWTPTLRLSTNTNVTADVKSIGGIAHVLLFDGGSSQLASIEYDGAGNYVPWTMRPSLTPVNLSGAETATIDVDSTGRMWVAADVGTSVQVRHSDGLYQSWSNPITVASGINSDDIAVVTALPNGTIGVLWSNQSAKRFGFRYHVDGAAPTEWSTLEVPANAAALNIGGGMADDHLNVAVASDGTLYAAVKTSYDSGSQAKIGLLVRRPNGVWDSALYAVDGAGTRPIVLLNESAGRLIVAYAASEGTANIVYRETSLGSISFGPRQTLISGSVQNVSSTKQNFTDEVAVIASNGSTLKSVLFSFDPIVVNQPPQADAGADRTVFAGVAVALDGSVQDDGVPAAATVSWSKVSGPGTVTFDDPTKASAKATFSAPGTYVLQLAATDGQYFHSDQAVFTVTLPPPDPSPNDVITVSFQDGVGGYTAARDTMIRALNSGTNYGSVAALEADGSPDIASLLAWSLASIPSGSVIVSAAIELYVTNSSAQSYFLHAMERAWDEFGATWNSAGSGGAWGSPGASAASDRSASSIAAIAPRNTGLLRIELTGSGLAAVQRWIDEPSSNHGVIIQNYLNATDGFDFRSNEAPTISQRPRLVVSYSPSTGDPSPPANAAPAVSAGPDRSGVVNQSISLSGTATDDGRPGPLVVQWTKQSGPGSVSFANAAAAATTATFTLPGTYVLRLSGSDGALSAYDEMTVVVANSAPTNQPPVVSAGPDRTVSLGSSTSLQGTVQDDGVSGPVTIVWTKASGPGNVTFGNAASAATTATFSQAGVYVLRLAASDGQYSVQDDVQITVEAPAQGPTTVSFQDGVGGYAGTRDTMIRAQNLTSNYGTLNLLEADGSPDIASLLSWDVSSIPAGSTVLSATIEIFVTNTTSDGYSLLAMERAWRELEATWSQGGAGLPWSSAGAAATGDRAAASLGVVSPGSTGRYIITLNAAGVAAVQRWIDDPTRNFGVVIQNYASASNGFDFRSREAADVSQRPKLSITYQSTAEPSPPPADGEPANAPPQASAGADRSTVVGTSVQLQGVVSDDGRPNPTLAVLWTQVSGPGTATFGNAQLAATSVTFNAAGVYVLRLSVSDGEFTAQDEVVVTVAAQPAPNQAPAVNAGPDMTATQGVSTNLAGSVSDDGPANNLAIVWSKVSGPGTASFQNSASPTTAATFSAPGVYVLRLSAYDGTHTSFDELTVTVAAPAAPNSGAAGSWQMESTAGGIVTDASGNGRDATVVGSPTVTSGASGNALAFNKSNYLLVNHASELNPANQITIAAWIKPSERSTQYVVKKGRQNATDGYELSLSSDGYVFVRFNQASRGDALRVNSTTKHPVSGTEWLHVAATYDGQTIKLYINGVLQSSKNASFQIASNALPLAIGAQDDGFRGFAGAIDGVAIYNRALSAEEIAALKSAV